MITVPSVNPNMITTDIETQNTSRSSGITPSTVVPAADNTGRKRDIAINGINLARIISADYKGEASRLSPGM